MLFRRTTATPTRARLLDKGDLPAIGKALAEHMVRRTKGGRRADGRRFRSLWDRRPSTLEDSGTMLASFEVEVVDDGTVNVGPSVRYAGIVQKDRPFVGMSAKDLTAFERAILTPMLDAIEAQR